MNDHIKNLVVKYLQGELTEDENMELQQWIHSDNENRKAFEEATDVDQLKADLKAEIIGERKFLERLKTEIANEEKVVSIRPKRWYRYVAAAAMILIIGSAAYYLWPDKKESDNVANTNNAGARYKNDVMPGSEKATLTLSDGRVISLDSTSKGILTTQGITAISNANGELIYRVQNVNAVTETNIKNTVSTQNGGEYRLTLSDGTKIWLNAASSLTFPVAFAGDERKVEITGEVYFDVTKSAKPFKVYKQGTDMEIQVLGTHFNVNTHVQPAEVTLLEGSVRVAKPGAKIERILKPGTQAQIGNADEIKLISNPDIEQVMAWKNGLFLMKNRDIKTIMQDVERWYNVKVVYKTNVSGGFSGEISRGEPLSKLLMILELTKGVRFAIDDNTITVLPGEMN